MQSPLATSPALSTAPKAEVVRLFPDADTAAIPANPSRPVLSKVLEGIRNGNK
jgi:hypothetical protein